MNITNIANMYTSQQMLKATGTNASNTDSTSAVKKAFSAAASRIDQQRQSASVQLSGLASVKSGYSQVQDTGKALSSTSSTTSNADIKKNLQAMVAAFNGTRTAAASAAAGNTNNNSANALQKVASNDSNRSDLKSLGITQNKDGSLTLDTKKLDAALQSDSGKVKTAASRVGGQMQTTASAALSSSSSLNNSLSSLSHKVHALETRQASQQSLADNAMANASGVTATSSANSAYSGISSYQNIFSL